VVQDGGWGDVRIFEKFISKNVDVSSRNGLDEALPEGGFRGFEKQELVKVSLVLSVDLRDLGSCGAWGYDRGESGVYWVDPRNCRDGGVLGIFHDKGKMAMGGATSGAGDGNCIGIDTLSERSDVMESGFASSGKRFRDLWIREEAIGSRHGGS